MNHVEYEFLRHLDIKGVDGTIQSFLMSIKAEGIEKVSFENVLKKLLMIVVGEKHHLIENNIMLSRNGGKLE